MKIAVIGAGGVGGYFGGRLAQSGNDVTFLVRGAHLLSINQHGLKVKSILGDFTVKSIKATDDLNKVGMVDLVIVAVKAWQVKEVSKDLHLICDAHTVLLPLENGILAAEDLASNIDPTKIIGGLCKIISKIEAPGRIHHFGVNPEIIIGELDKKKTDRIIRINHVLNEARINSKIAEDIHVELWKKFLGICVGGLLAVTRSTYGAVRELKETRAMMFETITEIYELSKKAGINLEKDCVEETVQAIDSYPYESTSSLTRDIWEGKPSEIEFQNGTVVKLGQKYGVLTPVNTFIYNCILPLEIKARHIKK